MRTQHKPFRRRRALRVVAGALGLGLIAGAWGTGAAAQENGDAERLVFRAVDATDTDDATLVYGWSGDPAEGTGVQVAENGDEVDVAASSALDAGWTNNIVFVVDTSGTTDRNAMLTSVEGALTEWVTTLPAGARASVVISGTATERLVGLSTDAFRLAGAVGELTPNGEGAVLSGLIRASTTLDPEIDSIPTVVLFTDGVIDSPVAPDRVEGALESVGAALYVVGLQDGSLDEGLFGNMAAATGGRMVVTGDAGDIPAAVADIRPEIDQQFAARWTSEQSEGIQDIVAQIDRTEATGSYISGSELVGAADLQPRPPVGASGLSFFHNSLGKWIGFAAALVACLLFAYGVVTLFVRDDSLTRQLRPYGEGYAPTSEDEEEEDEHGGALAHTALLQRAVAITEGFAQRQGFLVRAERLLEKADVPLHAGEAMFFYFAGVVLIAAASLAFLQNLAGTLIVVVLAALIPPSIVNYLATRKKKQFEALLPDTLQLLSSTLRAGYSMMQGVEAVSQETAEPMGKELRRVVTEARLGRPLEESLESVALRMESADFAWAVMAIRIQREVGGNLAELLLTVAETMTERERLRRDINSLTAEGRMSAYVLIALPIGLLLFLYMANREYMEVLFERTIGQILLAGAVLFMLGGYLWMRKIIKIEV